MTILALTDASIDLNKDNNQSTVTANVKNIPKESSVEHNNSSSNSSSNSDSNSDSRSDSKNRTQDLTPQRVKLLTALYERTGRGGKAEELYVRAVKEGLSSYSELGEYGVCTVYVLCGVRTLYVLCMYCVCTVHFSCVPVGRLKPDAAIRNIYSRRVHIRTLHFFFVFLFVSYSLHDVPDSVFSFTFDHSTFFHYFIFHFSVFPFFFSHVYEQTFS